MFFFFFLFWGGVEGTHFDGTCFFSLLGNGGGVKEPISLIHPVNLGPFLEGTCACFFVGVSLCWQKVRVTSKQHTPNIFWMGFELLFCWGWLKEPIFVQAVPTWIQRYAVFQHKPSSTRYLERTSPREGIHQTQFWVAINRV